MIIQYMTWLFWFFFLTLCENVAQIKKKKKNAWCRYKICPCVKISTYSQLQSSGKKLCAGNALIKALIHRVKITCLLMFARDDESSNLTVAPSWDQRGQREGNMNISYARICFGAHAESDKWGKETPQVCVYHFWCSVHQTAENSNDNIQMSQ